MKIKTIDVKVLKVPLDQPYTAAGRAVGANWHVMAEVTTEDGITGFGYIVALNEMFVAAVAFSVYDWRVIGPRLQKFRQTYIDHADEPEVANPAKEQFDRYHRDGVTVLSIVLFLLLGMILFSADITRGITYTFSK